MYSWRVPIISWSLSYHANGCLGLRQSSRFPSAINSLHPGLPWNRTDTKDLNFESVPNSTAGTQVLLNLQQNLNKEKVNLELYRLLRPFCKIAVNFLAFYIYVAYTGLLAHTQGGLGVPIDLPLHYSTDDVST